MSSREKILGKLRKGNRPFPEIPSLDSYVAMVNIEDTTQSALYSRFIDEVQKASCVIHQVGTPVKAIESVLNLLEGEKVISSWDAKYFPIPGLADALENAGISCVGQDENVRIGLTGVDAALAATGSIVLLSGAGRFRAASLLPTVHIAVMTADQIMLDLESWWGQQKDAGLDNIRQHSNIVFVTGPSRTADIAMELVMGMHGPRELHIVLLSK